MYLLRWHASVPGERTGNGFFILSQASSYVLPFNLPLELTENENDDIVFSVSR